MHNVSSEDPKFKFNPKWSENVGNAVSEILDYRISRESMPPSYLENRSYCARNPPLLYHCGHCFFPDVLNSLGVIRITFNFRFVLYIYSFSKDMLTAQQAQAQG